MVRSTTSAVNGSRVRRPGAWTASTSSSSDGTLVADTSKLIAGPPRGAKRFFTPAKGPSCVPKA